MPFVFNELEIPEVKLIEPEVFSDNRGSFFEIYKGPDFSAAGIPGPFIQFNRSISMRSVLRGLHYQSGPKAQSKLIQVISGEIFDVAVDIRKGSPSYGRWVSANLSEENRKMFFVPEGFLHGFCVISDIAEIIYFCTEVYSRENERGVIWDDPDIQIKWPIDDPVLSEKDSALPALKDAENKFVYEQ